LCWVFFEIGIQDLFAELASNPKSPEFCLVSSWNYRHEPPGLPRVCISNWLPGDADATGHQNNTLRGKVLQYMKNNFEVWTLEHQEY
jgi:hypothetical protein